MEIPIIGQPVRYVLKIGCTPNSKGEVDIDIDASEFPLGLPAGVELLLRVITLLYPRALAAAGNSQFQNALGEKGGMN